MEVQRDIPVQPQDETAAQVMPAAAGRLHTLTSRTERFAGSVFVAPAVLVVLFLSIFPLVVSLYLSLSRFQLVQGGFDIKFIGLLNYRKLLVGSERDHFLGVFAAPSPLAWLLLAVVVALLVVALVRYARGPDLTIMGLFWRVVGAVGIGAIAWLVTRTLLAGGRPGTLVVTFIYVFIGILFQYLIGLGLALLCVQQIRGRRFFRVVFLLPMMITPVGIAYAFLMLTDTAKGPFRPIWDVLGLVNFSWVNNPWGARAAVMIGDIWQWTPFMFIVLLAALEGLSVEPTEAALVDGANRRQIFRYIIWPGIFPVSTTLILIRMIEAFKIVDLPNVLTNGGPGTATESMTLQSYFAWRAQDLGGSAAIAYLLLIVVTFISISFVNLIRRRATEVV
ncbi:MAG TPA: sugar ABC transporter permease [Roseiflexaceae bacterium]|jgi:multiple sugar transport system permease protein